jgi:pimeloyl-ACP methyl ester carboxylesterase
MLEQTFEAEILHGWVRVERWQDQNPAFIQEDRFDLDARAHQTGQRLTFFANDPVPHSSRFLLHYAPGWDTASKPVPVLLAHGANDQADRAWANPGESGDFGCGQSSCPEEGLMQALAERGYAVFAITHPHSQGDNYFWAEQLADAIRIIRERTGAEQVDLVGWSKGVMSTRMYTSSVTQPWGTKFRGDVRKLVLIGGPNLGFDYIFRYGTAHNGGIYTDLGGAIHAPGPHDTLLLFGVWQPRPDFAIYKSAKGDKWRGQLQMLGAWDDVYPLSPTANNGIIEWAVGDSMSTYYGEGEYKGIYARGKGIDFAIQQGSVIEAMVDAGIPNNVSTYLLCGDIDFKDKDALIPGIPNEIAGPSDGVVFVESCAASDGIGQLAGSTVLQDVNHLKLGWHGLAVQEIDGWLAKD